MAESSISLLTNCKLTICDKIPHDDKNLNAFLVDTLRFEIVSVEPFVIEKDCPSPDDIHSLLDALKASLHSQNRKDDILADHHRDLIDLEQKKGNATCDSLMHRSSLGAVDGNRQSKKHSVESNCDDNCFNEASSQMQGNYDAEQDLINTFQILKVTDESNDHDHVQENEFESNLSGNSILQEPADILLVNENKYLLENARSTEKPGKKCQAECESKKQVEKTQKEYLTEEDCVDCEVENTQIKFTAAQKNNIANVINMSKEANTFLYEEEKKKNCESISAEKFCRTATDHVKCNNDAKQRNNKINVAQNLTTSRQENLSQCAENAIGRQHMVKSEDSKISKDLNMPIHGERTENTSRQENLSQCAENTIEGQYMVTSEDEKINKDLNMPIHGEDKTENTPRQESLSHCAENAVERQVMVKSEDAKINKDLNIPIHGEKTENTSRQERLSQCAENAIERQHMVKSEDAKISKDVHMPKQGEDKTENHNLISSDSACITADTTKKSCYCKMDEGDDKLNHAPYPAVRNGGTEKQVLEKEKNEKTKVVSSEITSKQTVETGKGEVHLSSSTENIHQPPDYDITKQEQLNKISQLETSKISSGSHKLNDTTESSDSDSESQHSLTGSIKASSLDGVKMHFKESVYDKYFDEAKNEGMGFIFRLNSSDNNAVSFISQLNKLKVEEIEFDDKEGKYLEAAVQHIEAQINGLAIQVSDGRVVIVGLKDSVTSAKKKLFSWLQNHCDLATNRLEKIKSNESRVTEGGLLNMNSPVAQKSQEASRNKISDEEKTHELMIRSQESEFNETHQNEPQSCIFPHDSPFQSSTLPVKTDYYGYSEHNMFSKDKNNYYAKNERSTLKVKIYKTNITKLEVDCIVNAANKRLQHGGGVAKAISLAAGPALNKECEAFINSGNQVPVTDIFLSTGGNLPAKFVMHAVGPKWDAYDDKSKPQCFDDLRHTVIRCLVEAGRQGFTSIALPSISAAIFKVPKEACARCYMEAVKHFATFNKEETSLHEIHFVDVDDAMVKVIQEHFEKNWTNPCDPHSVHKDCDFARSHVYSATRNVGKRIEKSPDTSKITSSSLSTKTPGANKPSSVPANRLPTGSTASSTSDERREESFAYQIGNFTLNTDTRPAFDLLSDITITVGQPFDKLSGLHNFSVSSNKQKKGSVKNIYTLYNMSKPKSHHQKLLCALFPEPECEERIKEALGNLDVIMQSPNNKILTQNIRKVVLTSSILYKEPDNVQNKNQHFYDRKKPGHFAKCLFDYLSHASEMPSISITLVGCEDAIQSIHKVMESRPVRKIRKISHEAQQGARSKTSEGSHYRSEGGYSASHSGYAAKGSDSSRQYRDEVHKRASSMGLKGSEYYSQGAYSKQPSRYRVHGTEHHEEDAGSSVDLDKTTCEICAWEKLCFPLKCCGKYICHGCQQKVTICPYCRAFWRVLIGDQPPGTMSVRVIQDSVAGYEHFPTLKITYFFPSGQQKDCHPNPGEYYTGMSRSAYLPATDEGFLVLKLLRLAFLRKLTFTIGRSLTMGRENSIVWNDIHHKTSLHGGVYGYPDPNYWHNVIGELASKGVTFDTVSPDEIRKITDFEYHILTFGHFADTVPE